jgi:hypothetical protein
MGSQAKDEHKQPKQNKIEAISTLREATLKTRKWT